MNYGVFKSFVEDEEEEEVINLLESLESRPEVKDVKIKHRLRVVVQSLKFILRY